MWFLLLVFLALILMYRWYRQSQILGNLSDKYVFITGCDTGFGRQIAKQLDVRGMKVLAACLTEAGAKALKNETSSRLQTVILDVTDSQSVTKAAKWVADIVADKGLWGLVNNAGILIPVSPNEWLKKDDFRKILDVNILGMVDVTINLLPLIRKSKGRIVNVSSIAGRHALCGGGYSISKYGVEAFSDSLRRELKAFGVKVSIIAPDFFKTEILNFSQLKENVTNTWKKIPMNLKNEYGENYYHGSCMRTYSFQWGRKKTEMTPYLYVCKSIPQKNRRCPILVHFADKEMHCYNRSPKNGCHPFFVFDTCFEDCRIHTM